MTTVLLFVAVAALGAMYYWLIGDIARPGGARPLVRGFMSVVLALATVNTVQAYMSGGLL